MSGPVAVVLGSGLGGFADTLDQPEEISYGEIPGWPLPSIEGHAGKMIEGRLGSTDVIVLSGRAHLYEGFSPEEVAYGIRTLARRGVKSLILTNAAGGINLDFEPGQLVLISDHLNLTGANPLTGRNDDAMGPRFPDMSQAYAPEFRQIAKTAGSELGMDLREGIYAGLAGPNFETPAEIRYLRTIGADLVGMSTVLEATAANHAGMKVLGISTVSNMAAGILPQPLTHQEVLATGERVKDTLIALLAAVIRKLGEPPPALRFSI